MNELDSLRGAGTPEDLFIVNPKAPKEIDTDTMLCAISRARAILELISASGDEEDYFRLAHKHIVNGLWAAEGILEQVHQMVGYSTNGGES